MTYAESQHTASFDWNAFLSNPPVFESPEHHKASRLSSPWVTCACGNQCSIIPRNRVGAPLDPKLCDLGCEFAGFISAGLWAQAKKCLLKIEARADELIKEIQKSTP